MHRRAIVSLLFISALVLAGCTTPPKAERAVAEDAVNAARAAGAEQYAPGEFALAIRALEAAAAHMDAHKYREAKALYEQVPSLSGIAARAAGRGKATQRAGVEQQLTGAERRCPRGSAQGRHGDPQAGPQAGGYVRPENHDRNAPAGPELGE